MAKPRTAKVLSGMEADLAGMEAALARLGEVCRRLDEVGRGAEGQARASAPEPDKGPSPRRG